MNTKGQAAMEYLMTYGWALLAIVVVIAVLIYLNPFRGPEFCLPRDASFGCNEPNPQFYSKGEGEQLYINVRLSNHLGKGILIKEITCTDGSTSQLSQDMDNIITVSDGSELIPAGSHLDGAIACISSDGSLLASSPGQSFRGTILIWYNYENEIDQSVRHEAILDLSGTVTQGAPPSQMMGEGESGSGDTSGKDDSIQNLPADRNYTRYQMQ